MRRVGGRFAQVLFTLEAESFTLMVESLSLMAESLFSLILYGGVF